MRCRCFTEENQNEMRSEVLSCFSFLIFSDLRFIIFCGSRAFDIDGSQFSIYTDAKEVFGIYEFVPVHESIDGI